MSKALQYNTISKGDYLTQKSIPNSAPMNRPQSELVKMSQVSPPVQAPTDVIASQTVYRENKEKPTKDVQFGGSVFQQNDVPQQSAIPIKSQMVTTQLQLPSSSNLQQQQSNISNQNQIQILQQLKGLQLENQELRAQLINQTREIVNAGALKSENAALRERADELKAIADHLREADSQNQAMKKQVTELQTEVNQLKAQNYELQKVADEVDSVRKEIATYKAFELQYKELLRQTLQLKSDHDALNIQFKKLVSVQEENKRVSSQFDQQVNENEQLKKQIAQQEKDNQLLLTDNISMKQLLDQMNFDHKNLRSQFSKLQQQYQQQYDENQKLKDKISQLELDIVQLKSRNDGLQKFVTAVDSREQEIGTLKYHLGMCESNMKVVQQNYDTSLKKLELQRRDVEQLVSDNNLLKGQLEHLTLQNRQLNELQWKNKESDQQTKQMNEEIKRLNGLLLIKNNECNQYKTDAQRFHSQLMNQQNIESMNKRMNEQILQMEKEIVFLRRVNQDLQNQVKILEEFKYNQLYNLKLDGKTQQY